MIPPPEPAPGPDADASAHDDDDATADAYDDEGEGTNATAAAAADADDSADVGWTPKKPEGYEDGTFGYHYAAARNAWEGTATPVTRPIQNAHASAKNALARRMGWDPDDPEVQLYLTLLMLLPMLPIALTCACCFKVISRNLTLHGAVRQACVYCACFNACLLASQVVTGAEPLGSYRESSGDKAYVRYQIVVLIVYVLHAKLTVANAFAYALWWPCVAQCVAIACVGFHYYFSAWHPAMVGESPRVVAGLPTGAATYGTYAVAYAAMAAVPMRTAARKPDFKVEMRRGEGAKLMGADAKEQD